MEMRGLISVIFVLKHSNRKNIYQGIISFIQEIKVGLADTVIKLLPEAGQGHNMKIYTLEISPINVINVKCHLLRKTVLTVI